MKPIIFSRSEQDLIDTETCTEHDLGILKGVPIAATGALNDCSAEAVVKSLFLNYLVPLPNAFSKNQVNSFV